MRIGIKKTFLSDQRTRRLLWAALALSLLISGWNALTSYDMSSVFVRVSMKSPVTGSAVLYYDIGKQFNAVHVASYPVYGDGQFHSIRLRIPYTEKIFNLRLDPPAASDREIVINKLDIIDYHENVLHNFKLEDIKPANQIKSFSLADGELHFSTEINAADPQLRITVERPISFNRLHLFASMLACRIIPHFLVVFLAFVLLVYIWSRWTDPVVAFMMILAVLTAGWLLYHDFQSVHFRVSMKSTARADTAELYYDRGYGLSSANSVRANIREDGQFHEYTFKIPRNIRNLRFDPSMKAGTVVIRKMRLTDRFGNVLQTFRPHQLLPAWEIRSFDFSAEGLTVKTADKATDPQILILLDGSWQNQARPLLVIATRALIEWSAILVVLLFCIYLWTRNRERAYRFIDGPYFQDRLTLICLGCAFGLILAMVFAGNRTCHPDEWGHLLSAGFYSESWLPRAVDDPKVLETVNPWGASYVFRTEVGYWFAGKFSALLSGLVHGDYLRGRLFNAFLFLILCIIAARRAQSAPLLLLALVVSPQIWYTFSYFNGDAFAFFVAMLIAWQLVDPESLANRFLDGGGFRNHVSGGILGGVKFFV